MLYACLSSSVMMVFGTGIRADFGVEGRFEPADPAAQSHHHLGNDMIFANAQPLAGDLQR